MFAYQIQVQYDGHLVHTISFRQIRPCTTFPIQQKRVKILICVLSLYYANI